jgi:hypothetical protein
MQTATTDQHRHDVAQSARRGTRAAALWGLAARGVLYVVLAIIAFEIAVGGTGRQADARGALHELASHWFGRAVLWLLAVGFAGFALWHVLRAFARNRSERGSGWERVADVGRAVVYGVLCAIAIGIATSSFGGRNSDQTDKTWTARVLGWPSGAVLVGAIGIAVIGAGLFLLWRAFSGDHQDEAAVLEAAPNEPPVVHTLGIAGNLARGAVVILIGVFLLVAAIQHDPNKTTGLDDTLRRLLDHSFGPFLVILVALGLAAFGVYSLMRAYVNRRQVARR